MVSRQVLISQVPRVMRTRMSVAFTLDRYGHLYEDREHEIPDRLDQLLASSSAGLTRAQSEELQSVEDETVPSASTFEEWPQRDLNPCYRLESSDQDSFRRYSTLCKGVRFPRSWVLLGPFDLLNVFHRFSSPRVQNVSLELADWNARHAKSGAVHGEPL